MEAVEVAIEVVYFWCIKEGPSCKRVCVIA